MELLPKTNNGKLIGFLVTFTERDPPELVSKIVRSLLGWKMNLQPRCAIQEVPTTLNALFSASFNDQHWSSCTPMTLSFSTDILEHGVQLSLVLMHVHTHWQQEMEQAHIETCKETH